MQSSVSLEEDAALKGSGFQTVKLSGNDSGNSTVTLKGAFDKLNVEGQGIAVSIPSGNVLQMTFNDQAGNNTLNLSANVIVGSMILDSSVNVTGQGTIQLATIDEAALESSFEKQPASSGTCGISKHRCHEFRKQPRTGNRGFYCNHV